MRSCIPLNRRRQILATLPLAAAVSTAITATSLLAPNTAMAQLEEVVVTARARSESLAGCSEYSDGLYRWPDQRHGHFEGGGFYLTDARRELR